MSRTYHHGKRRFVKYPHAHYCGGNPDYQDPAGPKWRRTKIEASWMTTPSNWVNAMMTRPQRAETRQALHLVMRGLEIDVVEFPHPKRPHVYYW